MIYIQRKETFCAAHKLWNEKWDHDTNLEIFGKCANPNYHGHNFELLVTVKGEIDPDTGFVEDIISVVYGEHTLTRTDLRLIGAEKLSETGEPREFWVYADNSIRIFPIPEERTSLKVYAVLKPSRSGTGVEDWIYETFADTIVSGAIAQLAMIPGKEWSDIAMAGMHKGLYERAITNARIRDFRGVDLMVRQRPAA